MGGWWNLVCMVLAWPCSLTVPRATWTLSSPYLLWMVALCVSVVATKKFKDVCTFSIDIVQHMPLVRSQLPTRSFWTDSRNRINASSAKSAELNTSFWWVMKRTIMRKALLCKTCIAPKVMATWLCWTGSNWNSATSMSWADFSAPSSAESVIQGHQGSYQRALLSCVMQHCQYEKAWRNMK